jgi:hypothetical protein
VRGCRRSGSKSGSGPSNTAIIGDDATAITVDQAADEVIRCFLDQLFLPWFQSDRPQMLLAGAVLWKQARPMFRVQVNFRAIVVAPPSPCTLARHQEVDRFASAVNDLWVARIEGDPHPPHAAAA